MIYAFVRSRDYVWDHEGLVESGSVWHFADALDTDTDRLMDVWKFKGGGDGIGRVCGAVERGGDGDYLRHVFRRERG